METRHCLVIHIIQNVFFVQWKKETHTDLKRPECKLMITIFIYRMNNHLKLITGLLRLLYHMIARESLSITSAARMRTMTLQASE